MRLYTYEFLMHNDPSFPIIFHKDYYEAQSNIFIHWHESVEMLCFIEGEAQVLSNTETRLISATQTAIINPGNIHSIATLEKPCQYYCLIVDPRLFQNVGINLDSVQLAFEASDDFICASFEQIHCEYTEQPTLYKQRVLLLVKDLLIHLYRNHSSPSRILNTHSVDKNQAVKRAVEYIQRNFAQPISLDCLSEALGYSKFYLCRIFKEYTSMTLTDYINFYRCLNARRLLRQEGKNVSESMVLCGYSSISHFSRQYKRYIGHRPSEDLNRLAAKRSKT